MTVVDPTDGVMTSTEVGELHSTHVVYNVVVVVESRCRSRFITHGFTLSKLRRLK